MTSDQIDAYAERVAHSAVDILGPDDAPGAILQAMMLAHLDHHSLDALVFCLEGVLVNLRKQLVHSLATKGTAQ